MTEEMQTSIMQLIIHAGDAKSKAYEALRLMKEGKVEESKSLMEQANQALLTAHNAQTELLQREAAGEKIEISALFVHAQDHLMTSMSEVNLIEQIIEMQNELNNLKEKLRGEK